MLSITTFFASALALFGARVHASPNLSDLTFDLPINPLDPNSPKISHPGPIQHAVASMEAAYPGWKATFLSQPAAPPPSTTSSSSLSPGGGGGGGGGGGSSPVSRIFEPEKYDCDVPGDEEASQQEIFDGIAYLRRLNGTARNGPGPANCGRVSCSWDAAIIWCNENKFEKEVNWRDIADAAAYVVVKCALDDTEYVKGHGEYTKEGWYVVVRRDWC
ncbi:hypothetical protein QBC41DRAFT_395963 [Cercophora samala]|uniref:Uncharacterized protein n=1 Tax=Cercophora samala TaxID=330535 RepID=A0AA39ZBT9_9PEZI|nr:hypothetical protein QBC41DRAFT_395963 [Cercophora samala]